MRRMGHNFRKRVTFIKPALYPPQAKKIFLNIKFRIQSRLQDKRGKIYFRERERQWERK